MKILLLETIHSEAVEMLKAIGEVHRGGLPHDVR